ncbi:MAG TPA: hypothetical protein HA354_00625 [Candidatus Poseidoniaceae archaeon]|nr:hypothetical protein [Euryarchaeota archaeon]DAC60252.1 MAG TPA: hypothetical protein D7I07_00615 [Candidatus Poseidoniales archaeon]HII36983.1 hypothetical protein [Candidatus Poseidoniaceae archaeon]
MEPVTLVAMGALSGGFLFGIYYTLVRSDAKLNMRPGMSAEGLRQDTGAPSFGRTKQEIDRKLAIVEARRRRAELVESRLAAQEAELRAAENARKLAEEAELERIRRKEAKRRAEEQELARREAEEQQKKAMEESERLRLEEESNLAKERQEEEERLAKEREELRQAEMAAAEEQRLAELEAAKLQEEMESRAAAEAAMAELQARLEREGAMTGDVQISLMWENFNDLDLHVVCPSGERIHGGNKKSECSGELDVDANVRPETKKPVENVVWPGVTAPPGTYQVYVHHYKKHRKRRTKDPTAFQIIVNNVGDYREYHGDLTYGDPIKLVCQFDVPDREEQAENAKRSLEEQMRLEVEQSARLEEEREAEERQRQADLAAAEEERLAELKSARKQEEIESRQAAETAMKELQARLDREGARSGDVQISLMWDNFNDLDLHVVCPSGERIHGGNKTSQCGGELDVDANVRPETKKPVENVVWADETAQPGEYQVYVHHYKKHKKRRTKDPTKFKVIVNNVGELLEFDGKLSHGDPIKLVAQFDVPTSDERQARIDAIRAEMDLLTGSQSKTSDGQEPEVEVEIENDEGN